MLTKLKKLVFDIYDVLKKETIYSNSSYTYHFKRFEVYQPNKIILSSSLYYLLTECIKKEPTNKVCILLNKLLKLSTMVYHSDNEYIILSFNKYNLLFKGKAKPNYIYLDNTKKEITIKYLDNNKIISYLNGILIKLTKSELLNDSQFLPFLKLIDVLRGDVQYYYIQQYKHFTEKKSIGRFLASLFPTVKASEIGNFINIIERLLTEDNHNYCFKLIKGNDISYYYNENNYVKRLPFQEYLINRGSRERDTLNKSCMRGNGCGVQTEFYAMFPDKINLAVLLDDNKLRARCLVWYADDGKTYFDRIFYVNENDYHILFKEMEKLGYINCSNSNSNNKKDFFITFDDNLYKFNLIMPYLDTVRQFIVKDNKTIFSTSYHDGYIDYTYLDRRTLKQKEENIFTNWYHISSRFQEYFYNKKNRNEKCIINVYNNSNKSIDSIDFEYHYPLNVIYDYKNNVYLYKNKTIYSKDNYTYINPNKITIFTIDSSGFHLRNRKVILNNNSLDIIYNDNNSIMSTYYGARIPISKAIYSDELESYIFGNVYISNNVYKIAGCKLNHKEENNIKQQILQNLHSQIKEWVKTQIK